MLQFTHNKGLSSLFWRQFSPFWVRYRVRNGIPVFIQAWKSKKKLWNSSHFFCVKLDSIKFEVRIQICKTVCRSGSRPSPLSIEKNHTVPKQMQLDIINPVEVGPKRPTVFVRLFQSLIMFNNFFTQNKMLFSGGFSFFPPPPPPPITVRPTILTWT